VPTRDKNAAICDKLLGSDWATPTRTQNVEEPITSRPPPTPEEVVARQPKIDPFELVKDNHYKVDLSELLNINIPLSSNKDVMQYRHPTKYLLFDNFFDHLCTGALADIGLPHLNGQEQAMYFVFYRFSYGYGYSACAMSHAALMKRLGWVRKRVKRVLNSLLDKKVIREEPEFPMFQHRRPQVYRVFLPRELLENALKAIYDTRGEIPPDVEQKIESIDPEIKDWIRLCCKNYRHESATLRIDTLCCQPE
jgi:hypothetical protein